MRKHIPKQKIFQILLSISVILLILIPSTIVLGEYLQIPQETETPIQEETVEEDEEEEQQTEVEEEISDTQEIAETEEEQTTTTTKTTTPQTPTPTPTPEPEPEPEPVVPESPSAVVAFYADNQSDTDIEDANHQRVVNYILASGANPVFHAGDLMEDGTQDSMNRFNSVTATLRATRAFYAALGNNDRVEGDPSQPSQLFLNNFTFPNNEQWYSVNYGNLHLVVLDSAFSSGSATQLSWLASDLQSSASQSRITGVMYHHPTFVSTISSQLITYGVDFVVAGHNHSYNHSISNGIHFFVLSGQPNLGYMIGRIYNDKVNISVYNSSNGVVDSIEFNER